ncbi:hypothetical protein GOFOIKOB_6499 [Methylobacterium tardum]|nr:hypothetical protein GOFOIKOB_6499 [Methylobacterium tardum]
MFRMLSAFLSCPCACFGSLGSLLGGQDLGLRSYLYFLGFELCEPSTLVRGAGIFTYLFQDQPDPQLLLADLRLRLARSPPGRLHLVDERTPILRQ